MLPLVNTPAPSGHTKGSAAIPLAIATRSKRPARSMRPARAAATARCWPLGRGGRVRGPDATKRRLGNRHLWLGVELVWPHRPSHHVAPTTLANRLPAAPPSATLLLERQSSCRTVFTMPPELRNPLPTGNRRDYTHPAKEFKSAVANL